MEDSYYKIGTSKHPHKRIAELQTGNPSSLKLVETYQSEFANQIETILHRRYSHLQKEGEWFEMSIENEILFKKECQIIEENLMFLKNKHY